MAASIVFTKESGELSVPVLYSLIPTSDMLWTSAFVGYRASFIVKLEKMDFSPLLLCGFYHSFQNHRMGLDVR